MILSPNGEEPSSNVRGKWQPTISIIEIMLGNVKVICYNVKWIEKIRSIHHISPISWIVPIFLKVDNFLHVPHFNIYISYPFIDIFNRMAIFSFPCLFHASIDIELVTFGNHARRITFNQKTITILQVWTDQTKINPPIEVVFLSLTAP